MSTQAVAADDVAGVRSRSFGILIFRDEAWDLGHLDAFTFQFEIEPDFEVTVLVTFSCHCFTHSFSRDSRPLADIPDNEVYDDGRERRVLCPERYEMSRRLLRGLMSTLASRRIILANAVQVNFMTFETTDLHGAPSTYAVFFEVTKAKSRRYRLVMEVQSAYVLDGGLSKRQRMAKKVTLRSILLAAMEGRRIRP